jgi:integrase
VLGLERGDVDFDGPGWIRIRDNRWRALDRGLKSKHSRRAVPLWPQLREVLHAHLARQRPSDTLLFPSHRHRGERPYGGLDGGALAAAVAKAEIDKPVTLHTLRHTYTAHRLCTIEGGAPVSVWDVACELGHRDTGMIERVYGHVLRDRDRRGTRGDEVRYETAKVLPLAARNA